MNIFIYLSLSYSKKENNINKFEGELNIKEKIKKTKITLEFY